MGTSYPQNRPIIMEVVKGLRPSSVLDIGCGWGFYGELLRDALPDARIDGLDGWEGNRCERWANYDKVFIADARSFDYMEYDLYLLVDCIEHMTKEQGLDLLDQLTRPVLVSTPRNYPQGPGENPYQEHVSAWSESDFSGVVADFSTRDSIIVLVDKGGE